MSEARPPVTTVGGTFSPAVTAASLPEQPVASSSLVSEMSTQVGEKLQNDIEVVGQSAMASRIEAKKVGTGWPKARRRGDDRDTNAPRPPLTGYIRFLNEHRERMRKDQPSLPFAEATRILGVRWRTMPAEEKERYRSEALMDKIAYAKELDAYKQTEAYVAFMQKKALVQKQQREGVGDLPGFNMPIFTEEFLDYNKGKDLELQALRRANAECEEKNTLLEEHIQKLRKVVSQLDQEAEQRQAANIMLEGKLIVLRTTLIGHLSKLPLPDNGLIPTNSTVDTYMTKLQGMLTDPVLAVQHRSFLQQVKEILGTIDLNSIFNAANPVAASS